MLLQFPSTNNPEVDLKTTYDAVVVGSGAAGGMAAHVLTSHGLKVLLLEAGKYQDTSKILHSMEWPYDHPRRGKMPPDYHALSAREYTFRKSPYAENSPYKKVTSYVQQWGGSDYSKTRVVDEKQNPYSGTRYAWVRSRCVSRLSISKPKITTDMAKTGPSRTLTSRRITTGWTATSACLASRRT